MANSTRATSTSIGALNDGTPIPAVNARLNSRLSARPAAILATLRRSPCFSTRRSTYDLHRIAALPSQAEPLANGVAAGVVGLHKMLVHYRDPRRIGGIGGAKSAALDQGNRHGGEVRTGRAGA